jgi:hypothetical protein
MIPALTTTHGCSGEEKMNTNLLTNPILSNPRWHVKTGGTKSAKVAPGSKEFALILKKKILSAPPFTVSAFGVSDASRRPEFVRRKLEFASRRLEFVSRKPEFAKLDLVFAIPDIDFTKNDLVFVKYDLVFPIPDLVFAKPEAPPRAPSPETQGGSDRATHGK